MASYYGREFDEALRRLRRELPTPRPVRVVTVPKSTLKVEGDGYQTIYGDYFNMGKYARIRVARGIGIDAALDALAHEFAHALDDPHDEDNCREHHRASWGVWYSKCYRVVFG